jgi:alpha-beta hydrolase superfamily lysophospholipase/SAM-dependent methyltransferase
MNTVTLTSPVTLSDAKAPVATDAARPQRVAGEHTACMRDGTELFYRAWLPAAKAERAVVLFHRGHEHSGRWQDLVDEIGLDDFAFFAWDARGHGRSPGARGNAESVGQLVRDADAFVKHIAAEHGIAMENIVVLAHSVGAVLASAWVHDYAPPVRALVLGSPALRVRLYVPFAIPALRLLMRIRPKSFVTSYVKGKLLTHDVRRKEAYDSDPLITQSIAVNILVGLYDTATRLMADAAAITTPTLMLTSGADWVVKQPAQRKFFEALGAATKEMHVFPGFLHDTFGEQDRHLPIAEARRFILERFAEGSGGAKVVAERHDQRGYEALNKPLPLLSPKRVGFAVTGFLMKTVGRLSEGIRLGWRDGFDSGAMLDYVYRNRARGVTAAGRAIDRMFLDSPGWRGIRTRKRNLDATLSTAMRGLAAEGRPVRLLDIATGHGRYILDSLAANPDIPATALLRDWSADNVEAGRRLAAEVAMDGVHFEIGDAFDADSIAGVEPKPTLAVVSGLYELYPDNAPVRASLSGIARAVEPGGYLVYTNQPWHPQQELIARVLTSHRGGDAWVMRCRGQAEMDALVREAGFEKIVTEIDDEGIFSVSVARRQV